MRILAVGLLPLALGSLSGQERPQLVWQGEVEGITILSVKGKRIEAGEKRGAAVQNQRFHFNHTLPDSALPVRLEKLEGRGYVSILEQPRADNNYTLAVSIEDRQAGSAPYSLAFYWDTSGERLDNPRESSRGGRLTWKGRVDEEVVISCHQNTCDSKVTSGKPVLRESVRFSHTLPESEVEVTLDQTEGRGQVRLIEPPREKNGYTARVLIQDPESGASDYSFTLAWARPIVPDAEPPATQLGLIWKGRVDGRLRVTIRGGSAMSQTVSGKPVAGEGANFYRPLPSRSGLNPALKKLSGSGDVRIIELPSAQNQFTLVFEIDNHNRSGDDYQIQVDW